MTAVGQSIARKEDVRFISGKGRYTDEQRKVISTALFQEVDFDGTSIATYRWHGKGKTILLSHGWESNASRWSYILDELITQGYDVIALDGPAHGRSGGKLFNALLYPLLYQKIDCFSIYIYI